VARKFLVIELTHTDHTSKSPAGHSASIREGRQVTVSSLGSEVWLGGEVAYAGDEHVIAALLATVQVRNSAGQIVRIDRSRLPKYKMAGFTEVSE
jgi:hypothetical protein